jgi:hypothetical protein
MHCRRCGQTSAILYRTPERWDTFARPCGPCYQALRVLHGTTEATRTARCNRCRRMCLLADLKPAPERYIAARVCNPCWQDLWNAPYDPNIGFKETVGNVFTPPAADRTRAQAFPDVDERESILRRDAARLGLDWMAYYDKFHGLVNRALETLRPR